MRSAYARVLAVSLSAAACGEGLNGSPTGSVRITSVTEGAPSDPDGYTVAIDAREAPLAANGTITVTEVTPGDHRLELRGIAPSCLLAGANPRTITVTAEEILRVTLEVSCAEARGSITLTTETVGPSPDPDGYLLQLDGGTTQTIDGNSLLTYPALPVGDHTLLLSSVAANCSVSGPNPRTVAVTSGGETMVTFSVTCRSTGPGTLLISSDRSGELHVYRVEPDGTGLEDLTPQAEGTLPDWSPDRTRIAFGSIRSGDPGVYVMEADGSSPVLLTPGGTPVWSPDGHRIAFSGPDGVTVMNADGSDPVVLAPGYAPAWSPDGTQIAFNRVGQCAADICGVDLYVVSADGSVVRKLTASMNIFDQWLSPSWSPDGTRIAFTRDCCFLGADLHGVETIAPSGGRTSRVYTGPVRGKPVWSPDGATLAFAAAQDDGTTELMLIPSGGGLPAVVATSPGSEYPGSWR
jgi:Tol biopolymer transport system component